VVLTAAPGAGKTTRVSPALAAAGPVIVLQPRRVAARSVARRIADEQGWTLGREVGWHVRFERRFGSDTRLLLATEGILTARLQQDPLLSDFHTIVLDEFHERSIHADLGIALAKQAWVARDDLRIVVMSATMDPAPVAAYLGGCPVLDVPGRAHPLDISYHPDAAFGAAVGQVVRSTPGQVLCFLAGAAEIRRAAVEVAEVSGGSIVRSESELKPAGASAIEIVPLHGSLEPAEQDRALAHVPNRRVILATNIAETSLTVPGVTAVVDTGIQKVARYDPDRAIDSLESERISQDSADQRAGRAARLGPGIVWRLWHKAARLRPHREPDIHRIDLSGPLLDVLAWGGDPRTLDWFDPPAADALAAGMELLQRLGAAGEHGLTPLGRRMHRLPVHPRLARILIAAGGTRSAALACALLSERHFLARRTETTDCDLLSGIERERDLPPHVLRVAEDLIRVLSDSVDSAGASGPSTKLRAASSLSKGGFSRTDSVVAGPHRTEDASFRHALLQGYPDRVAKRREPGSPRVLLASGHGAMIADESGVRGGQYLVALDVQAARRDEAFTPARPNRPSTGAQGALSIVERRAPGAPASTPARTNRAPGTTAEARIRIASIVDADWLSPTATRVEHEFDPASGIVRAYVRDYYGSIVLSERNTAPDPQEAARLLAAAYISRGLTAADDQLLRRLRFAGFEPDVAGLVAAAAGDSRSLATIDLERGLTWDTRNELTRVAPATLTVPSGRSHPLDYQADGSVSATVKLQELFGLGDTPRIGPRAEPVLLILTAPNGRAVQMTRDLRSFWERTYPEVRRELRGRYPKHPWPEDPWTAVPTARATRKKTT
jgi:ATP-dependent helicase HrpB